MAGRSKSRVAKARIKTHDKPRASKLTKRDLETIMVLFGFYDVEEFAKFVSEQDQKEFDRTAIRICRAV